MIILIKGKVTYPITLDPSVWIFDDRKIPLEYFLSEKESEEDFQISNYGFGQKIKPPVQASLEKFKQAGPGSGSYVMPLKPFLERSEPYKETKYAELLNKDGLLIAKLTFSNLRESVLLFSINGKQITDDGPVHLYSSNDRLSRPIKAFSTIVLS